MLIRKGNPHPIFTNSLVLALLFTPNLFQMTGMIPMIDQAAYQQMAMIWKFVQTLCVISLDQLDFQSSSLIIDEDTGLCRFNLVRLGILKYLVSINLFSFRRALSNSARTPTHPHSPLLTPTLPPPTQNNAPPIPTQPK